MRVELQDQINFTTKLYDQLMEQVDGQPRMKFRGQSHIRLWDRCRDYLCRRLRDNLV